MVVFSSKVAVKRDIYLEIEFGDRIRKGQWSVTVQVVNYIRVPHLKDTTDVVDTNVPYMFPSVRIADERGEEDKPGRGIEEESHFCLKYCTKGICLCKHHRKNYFRGGGDMKSHF